MKIIGTPIWFTIDGETIGVILLNDGYEDKAYIGKGKGLDEKEDIEIIRKRGVPFPVESAKLMCGA